MAGAKVFCLLELLADLGGLERKVGGEAEFSAGLHNTEGLGSARLVGDNHKNIARPREGGFELGGGGRGFIDQVAEDDIAHAETDLKDQRRFAAKSLLKVESMEERMAALKVEKMEILLVELMVELMVEMLAVEMAGIRVDLRAS